ncbi:nuclear transport factor 2 family protein [Stieleria marina]|uniref:SnoaL-like domain protein n=1 Tax=Stieleria marina TaxID=1930275 RepID=A0A517NVD8_9BACT|nr:SnoaL-like domain protein [Planctomycetes bacterium K23_9]
MSLHDDGLTPEEMVNKGFLLTWVKRAWTSPALASVEEYFHPDCVVTGMAPEVLEGIAQVQAVYNTLHSRVEHKHAEVSFAFLKGEHFSMVMELQGVHRESDVEVVIEVAVFGRMKDGQIFQVHNVVDYSHMYAKLGMLDVAKIRTLFG